MEIYEKHWFRYLKSLFNGEVACTIAGFALTNENYENAVELLGERFGQFGQSQKIDHAYMIKISAILR